MRKLGCEPPGVLRHDRPASTAGVAGRAMRLCRMAALPGGARLPRRGAWTFLLGPVARLIREVVEARISTGTAIEIFHAGQRVAAHPRSALKRRHTTTPEHMPSAHRRYARLDSKRGCCRLQLKSGRERKLWSRPSCAPNRIPSRASGRCLGILRMAKTYGEARLEAACQRGLTIGAGARTYGSVASILRTGPRPGIPRRCHA